MFPGTSPEIDGYQKKCQKTTDERDVSRYSQLAVQERRYCWQEQCAEADRGNVAAETYLMLLPKVAGVLDIVRHVANLRKPAIAILVDRLTPPKRDHGQSKHAQPQIEKIVPHFHSVLWRYVVACI